MKWHNQGCNQQNLVRKSREMEGTNIKRDLVNPLLCMDLILILIQTNSKTTWEICTRLDILLYWGVTVKIIIDDEGIVTMTIKKSPPLFKVHSEIFLSEIRKYLGMASKQSSGHKKRLRGRNDLGPAMSWQWLKLDGGHKVGSLYRSLYFGICLEFSRKFKNGVYVGREKMCRTSC